MRIMMTPGLCSNKHRTSGGTFCASCFAAFLLHGCYPERVCITEVIDDSRDEITLVLCDGDQQQVVTITDEDREALAYGGWQGWVEFVEQLPIAPRSPVRTARFRFSGRPARHPRVSIRARHPLHRQSIAASQRSRCRLD